MAVGSKWLLGPHFSDSFRSAEWSAGTVGAKALTLSELPVDWVPPFGVTTALAYGTWRRQRVRLGGLGAAKLVTSDIPRPDIARISGDSREVVVRSSSVEESLRDRGLHRSTAARPQIDSIADASNGVWDAASHHSGEMALVLQRRVKTVARGHLSNERRMTPKQSDWVCQVALGDEVLHRRVRRSHKKDFEGPLLCRDITEMFECLTRVAAFGQRRGRRQHFEWVWDGNRLWIVQCDPDVTHEEVMAPGQPWRLFAARHRSQDVKPEVVNLTLLKTHETVDFEWDKVSCIAVFNDCELPLPRVYVLEDPMALSALALGAIPAELKADLEELLKCPVVIRTDVRKRGETEVLSPRTDVVLEIADAVGFLERTSESLARLLKDGRIDGYCFLFHRFVPARCSAFAYADPAVSRVQVDVTYGSPDSLLYYSHDSFECDTRNPKMPLQERIRCKEEFIDIGPDGLWSRYWCAQPHDWKPATEEELIRECASQSHAIAVRVAHPVNVMFFVDVDPTTGYPPVLPWVYPRGDSGLGRAEGSASRMAADSYQIRKSTDLRTLETNYSKLRTLGHAPRSIRVRPDVDMVRSDDFTQSLCQFALEHDVAVELEGSVLSHIYYTLRRENVRVRCVDPFEPTPKRRVFDKLVRDRIPEQIRSHGETTDIRRVGTEEHAIRLRMKLVEEAWNWPPRQTPTCSRKPPILWKYS